MHAKTAICMRFSVATVWADLESIEIGKFKMLKSLWLLLILPEFRGRDLLWLFLVAYRKSEFCMGNLGESTFLSVPSSKFTYRCRIPSQVHSAHLSSLFAPPPPSPSLLNKTQSLEQQQQWTAVLHLRAHRLAQRSIGSKTLCRTDSTRYRARSRAK